MHKLDVFWPAYSFQCAIPAFEGLFPEEHNNIIRVLLFRMAEWHALAKMRLHSDDTLQLLDQSLRRLGTQLRKFSQLTCSAFRTMELPTEVSARYKRQHKGFESQSRMNTTNGTGPRPKSFNLFTYKFHALGDYVQSIRTYGTTDSYTTQIVSSFSRVCTLMINLDTGRGSTPSYQEVLQDDQQTRCSEATRKTWKAAHAPQAAAAGSRYRGTYWDIAGTSPPLIGFMGQCHKPCNIAPWSFIWSSSQSKC